MVGESAVFDLIQLYYQIKLKGMIICVIVQNGKTGLRYLMEKLVSPAKKITVKFTKLMKLKNHHHLFIGIADV